MGLERLACIMQGVDNIFEVDTVQNIMKKSAKYQALSIMKMLKRRFASYYYRPRSFCNVYDW